jgi:hypothetical protein
LLLCPSSVFPGPARAAETVATTAARLADATRYLASDELEGRGVGTKGLDAAAEYIAAEFKKIGLKTDLFQGTPFQTFKVPTAARLGAENRLALVGPDGKELPLALGDDFNPLALGGSGQLDLPLAFVGYGITAKDLNYDDYAGIDVQGKAVIVLRHEPQQDNPHSVFDGSRNSPYAPLSRKISNAYEHGAAAVIFCSTEHGVLKDARGAAKHLERAIEALAKAGADFKSREPTLAELVDYQQRVAQAAAKVAEETETLRRQTDKLLSFSSTISDGEGRDFPVVHCRRRAIDQVLRAALNTDLSTLERRIDEDMAPRSAELAPWRVKGKISIDRQQAEVKNVVGVLEGQGPRADETLVIGAHYDHLGRGGPGSLAPGREEIHNGADDNGSGTAALMEVARRLAGRQEKLFRRIVFIAFTGEERGLLGSAHYVKNPLFPLEKTIAMLNMDMVGRLRDDKLVVYGTGSSPELEQILVAVNQKHGFELSKQPTGFGPSDQTSFYAKEIPVLHFFTGIHSDYHRPSDDYDKLNVEGMARIVDLVADIAVEVASADKRPQYKATGRQASFGGDGDRPYFGSIPEFGQEESGYPLSGVTKDSPAEKAGLKAGDVIVQLGESKIGSLEDFDSALRKHKGGDKVMVTVKRDGQQLKLEVTLDPPR